MSSPSTSSSTSSPSLFHSKNPCFDSPNPNSEPKNPRIVGISKNCNLEMCTETLGFENGAMCFNCEMEIDAERKQIPPAKQGRSAATVFPPPLTTRRGKETLILMRRIEEGRLLLIAFRPLVLEAERNGERLVIRMSTKRGLKRKEEKEEEREVEEEEEEEEGEKEELAVKYGFGGKRCCVAARFGDSDALLLAR